MYEKIYLVLNQYFEKATLFKVLFNWSPMYKRSCGKIIHVSKDLHTVKIKIPLTYKNKNYVGSLFGGSLFAATDPIYMIQLMQILGKDYVVWDKASVIRFKKPAYTTAYAEFHFSSEEIKEIQQRVTLEKEVNFVKHLNITDLHQNVFTELEKTLYISSKAYYKQKLANKKAALVNNKV
jgi:acyl-CoA hydrolase